MKTLIVYDSYFTNTEQIAYAVADALQPYDNVETLRVNDTRPEQLMELKLLIVGSPTRASKPTKAINSFLDKIPPNGLQNVKVSAFDTRISAADVNSRFLKLFVKAFGYAAKPIADKLEKKGGQLVVPPEGFFVKDSEGPLKEGELERAAEWAKLVLKKL